MFSFFGNVTSNALSGISKSDIILNNESGCTYHDLRASIGSADFDTDNLLGFSFNDSFVLNGTQNKIHETPYSSNTATLRAIDNCPTSFSVNNDAGTCGAVVNFTLAQTPTSDDINNSMEPISSLFDGDTFPIGTTTVVYEERDASNTATGEFCSFDVTVVDNENPTASNLGAVNVECIGDVVAANILDVTTEADNCGIPVVAYVGDVSDGNFNPEEITRTYSVTDASGNTINVTQIITIEDTIDPTVVCQDITIQLDAAGNASIVASDIDNGSADTCTAVTLSASQTAFTCANIGTNNVTLTVTDAAGNDATCVAVVTVEDNIDPTPDVANLPNVTGECEVTTLTPPTATDNCGGTITVTNNASLPISGEGTTTILTWTYDDGNGNISTQTQNVIIDDISGPVAPTLSVITGHCSATVPVPTTTDGCSGSITGTTSDPLNYNSQGSYAVTWNFDDGNGNSINVVQNIVINDTVDPIAVCQDITIQLDDITGLATITDAQIDNGSSDNCGVVNFTLSQMEFDCTNIGSNVIVLTIDDGNGNTNTCTSTVTVISPNITGGTVLGFLNNNQTIADESNLVEVTACPDEPQNGVFNLYGQTGNVVFWESSNDGGMTWTTIANTTSSYFYADILETTLVRAVIQIGSCQANSSIIIVAVIPPDIPPTIIGPNEFTFCLGEDITVEAESSFGINIDLEEGGTFNTANLNNLGWLVDGTASFSAGGNSTDATKWKGTNGPKQFGGQCYNTTDGKFAIAYGVNYETTLETPIFNTLGLSTATLEFDQAFYLNAGASCKVELSLDGGITYPIILDPGPTYNYTGPSDSGFVIQNMQGNSCDNVPSSFIDNHVSMDLQNYIGLVGLRVKFSLDSNPGSTWALENIIIPQAPVDEIIEWTDGTGTVVTTGSITTITPVTPGAQTFGVTSLINGCRADGNEGTEFISVNASLAYAGRNITPITGECGQDIVSLNAYDNTLTAAQNIVNGAYDNNYTTGTYPGTGEAGVWNVVASPTGCGSSFSFSNLGDPSATFSGDPGTYTLSWTVDGCVGTVDVTLDSCQSLDFDGTNDHVVFDNNYSLSGDFSVSIWVKPESIGGQQTILSKRDPNAIDTGYDLKINNSGRLIFSYDTSSINSGSHNLSDDRWYYITIVHTNTSYALYVDGIQLNTANGSAPSVNTSDCILGATERTNGKNRFFNGWIDELRIWNKALDVSQLRETMNQEIEDNIAVRGVTVPIDISGLAWADLEGYYRMDVNCGFLTAYKGIRGRLRNINSAQQETAPIPYTSRVDGQDWATDDTWTHFSVWDAPNSLGIDGLTPIDWNIVQTSHNINSGDKDITVLGLLVDSNELSIQDPTAPYNETNVGQMLWVTHYLKLDGIIDLVGESQLVQKRYGYYDHDLNPTTAEISNQFNESILDVTSSGVLERDQQGTTNLYNYNYWSSPVSASSTTSNNNPFGIASVLRDGTTSLTPLTLQWTTAQDAIGSTSPITQSSRWLYAYENYPVGSTIEEGYAQWRDLAETDVLATGLSFTLKGSGAGDPVLDVQNYVFVGKPNNATITTPVTIGNQAFVGNPYPSAIDADQFIRDNLPGASGNPGSTQSTDGTLYFWEHYTSNFTHVLEDYEGGYATYNLAGGNPAVSPPLISGNGTSTKLPGQYIPISQGFFVTASNTGGGIQFKNSQRVFARETEASSQFIRSSNPNMYTSQQDPNPAIKRVRLDFITQEGAIRPLLLAFVSNDQASDGFDFGYDAENADAEFSNDMFWRIEDLNYTVQGVGDFDETKQYPLGLFLNATGSIEIALKGLENFDEEINVYIFDALMDNYFDINDANFEMMLDADNYLDRFYVAFSSEDFLSIEEEVSSQTIINYLNTSKELYIKIPQISEVKSIQLMNLLGQDIQTWNAIQDYAYDGKIRIPVKGISEGTYIIKVSTGLTVHSNKIIINE
jgi:hypothetical protein